MIELLGFHELKNPMHFPPYTAHQTVLSQNMIPCDMTPLKSSMDAFLMILRYGRWSDISQ